MRGVTLVAEHITKKYGPTVVLDGLSLTVPPGARIGVVGPNGAGKTTLLDAITGTVPLAEGVVRLAGSSLDKVVRVNIFLSDEKDFEGLNKVYREFFPDNFPARRTILSPLVGGFRCEIDCTALE